MNNHQRKNIYELNFAIELFKKLYFQLTGKEVVVKALVGGSIVRINDGKEISTQTFYKEIEWLQAKLGHNKPVRYTTSKDPSANNRSLIQLKRCD